MDRNYLGGVVLEVGGAADHVHILAGLKATHCLADVLREIKKGSSAWVHGCSTAAEYIRNQEEHHRKRSFQEEYREFLEEHGIEFDERYLW